jgi:hypothetical protein
LFLGVLRAVCLRGFFKVAQNLGFELSVFYFRFLRTITTTTVIATITAIIASINQIGVPLGSAAFNDDRVTLILPMSVFIDRSIDSSKTHFPLFSITKPNS